MLSINVNPEEYLENTKIKMLTLSRMGHFRAAYGWWGDKKAPSLKSVTHILQ